MQFKFLLFFICVAAAILSGCSQITLPNGKYETTLSGREDFVAVYDDLIFVRIKEPDDDQKRNSYWDWAGNFSIEDDGHIVFKMDNSTARKWNFHYDFFCRNGSIIVHDVGSENSFQLRHRPGSAPQYNNFQSQQGDFTAYK